MTIPDWLYWFGSLGTLLATGLLWLWLRARAAEEQANLERLILARWRQSRIDAAARARLAPTRPIPPWPPVDWEDEPPQVPPYWVGPIEHAIDAQKEHET